MSIIEKTRQQLVKNRLHTLCDIALEASARGQRYPTVVLDTSRATAQAAVRTTGADGELVSPEVHIRDFDAVEQLDSLVTWLRQHNSSHRRTNTRTTKAATATRTDPDFRNSSQ